MNIRRAKSKDVDAIYMISLENTLKKEDKALSPSENGFLVSGFTKEEYMNMIAHYHHFYVVEEKNKVVAFLFGYESCDVDYNLRVNQEIKKHANGTFFIIKQICVKKGVNKRGYGSYLYEYVIDKLRMPIYAAIVAEPYNEASIQFHLKHEFRRVFSITPEDGMLRYIYCNAQFTGVNDYNHSMLEQQYEMAIDLYLHEDSLNWAKLNNLFYISGGLVAVISILASLAAENLIYSIMVVSFLGIIAASLFSVAIGSGVTYMNQRKETVMEIEKLLIQNKGTNVVLPRIGKSRNLLRKSPTSTVMIQIPRIILTVWSLVFCITIFLVMK